MNIKLIDKTTYLVESVDYVGTNLQIIMKTSVLSIEEQLTVFGNKINLATINVLDGDTLQSVIVGYCVLSNINVGTDGTTTIVLQKEKDSMLTRITSAEAALSVATANLIEKIAAVETSGTSTTETVATLSTSVDNINSSIEYISIMAGVELNGDN